MQSRDTNPPCLLLLILAKKEHRFLQLNAGKGSLKQSRYQPPFDQPHEEDVVANRQRTVKTCQRNAKTWGNYSEHTHESALVADMLLSRTVARPVSYTHLTLPTNREV